MKRVNMSTLREKLLDAALIEVRSKGYSGASIMDILNVAGGKKGSLYHHFSSKKDLILKMIEERILRDTPGEWESLKGNTSDYLDNLIVLLKDSSRRDFINGCILGTLVQELSCEDEPELNEALNKAVDEWQAIFILQLQKAQDAKEIRKNVNVEEVSILLISILQGAMLVSKMKGNDTRYNQCITQMINYLNTLRIKKCLKI